MKVVNIIIAVCMVAAFMTYPRVNADVNDTPVISGKVFAGTLGDTSTPLPGVTLTLVGSMSPTPLGDFLDATVTGPDGWYSLDVTSTAYVYINIIETDIGGFTSVGAASAGGTVGNANWIYYSSPLTGKDLTGNRFWDDTSPHYYFQGKVFMGNVLSETNPLVDVKISLYSGLNPMPALGTLINETYTNTDGWYRMGTVTPGDYYRIVLTVPDGFRSIGAVTEDGTVWSTTVLDFLVDPGLPYEANGNRFWIKHALYLPITMKTIP